MENSGECKAPVGEGICGETNSLRIVQHKFHKIYDEKLQEILQCDGANKPEEIIALQTQWIANLSEQNCLFVDTVEKLEAEALERVQMLEEKLHKSARYISEVMKKYIEHDFTNDLLREPMEKLFYLENDKRSLLEFISRIRKNDWSTSGLTFYSVDNSQLFGEQKDDAIIITEEVEIKK